MTNLFLIAFYADFPDRRKVAPWHSHPVAILSGMQGNQHFRMSTSSFAALPGKPCNDDKPNSHPISIAQKTVLKPHSENYILVTTTAYDINTVELWIFKTTF